MPTAARGDVFGDVCGAHRGWMVARRCGRGDGFGAPARQGLGHDPSCPWLIRALTRAAHTGYNTPARLPALINDNQPLPDQHPARALLYRLAQDWPQTITPPPGTRRRDRDNDRLAVEAIRYHERSADRSMERDR